MLSSYLENVWLSADSGYHTTKWNKEPLEKLLYRQVYNLQCTPGLIDVSFYNSFCDMNFQTKLPALLHLW